MKKYPLAVIALLATVAAPLQAAEVTLRRPIPYAEDSDIASNIKRECAIDEKLADFIAESSRAKGISIRFKTDAAVPAQGRYLEVEIRDAVSSGNAFLGHHKSTSVRGKLYEDGKIIASFKGRRDSMGGAFAGYKGSCSVLGRTVKALGGDIAGWLASPSMDAELGDRR